MSWIKQGLIFKPHGNKTWSKSHAQLPVPLVLEDRLRIYYTTRDEVNRSTISYIETSRRNPSEILYEHDKPILTAGKPGAHDEDGVFASCFVQDGNDLLLYYMGISKGCTVPYKMSIGLAISRDGGLSFERIFDGPIVDRTPHEPYMTTGPMIIIQEGLWRMWYSSGIRWEQVQDKLEPIYVIKYAESKDGRFWQQDNILCIEQLHPLEANTRPSVLHTARGYEMWFCYRHSFDFRNGNGAYRIGYAISSDGLRWTREADPVGLLPAGDGWDSLMTAYPHVTEVDGQRYIFYNGDGFGASGFGYAVGAK